MCLFCLNLKDADESELKAVADATTKKKKRKFLAF